MCSVWGRLPDLPSSSKSAAQRHVHKGSCGRPVRNHGHAGAMAGQRLSATAVAPQAQTRPPLRALVQSQLRAFFHPQNAGDGFSKQPRAPPVRRPKRSRGEGSNKSKEADAANAEAQSSSGGTRQQPQRTRGLVHPHLASGSGERTFANAHGSDGCLERQTTTRTTTS